MSLLDEVDEHNNPYLSIFFGKRIVVDMHWGNMESSCTKIVMNGFIVRKF